jgi:hypothetical protein
MSKKRVNTVKALEFIRIDPSGLTNLSKHPKTRCLLQKWGVDPDCYYPEMDTHISEAEWLRLLIFYARMAKYPPARAVLENALEKVRKEIWLR